MEGWEESHVHGKGGSVRTLPRAHEAVNEVYKEIAVRGDVRGGKRAMWVMRGKVDVRVWVRRKINRNAGNCWFQRHSEAASRYDHGCPYRVVEVNRVGVVREVKLCTIETEFGVRLFLRCAEWVKGASVEDASEKG